jgi:hypothetical protein
MEEVTPEPTTEQFPSFETFPDAKPPENNPETVAGKEAKPATIKEVNPSTNQAAQNAQNLQAGSPTQNTGGNLQTGGGIQTGGNDAVNNLLNQGAISNKPLSVGVASASTASKTNPDPLNTQPSSGSNGVSIFIVLLVISLFAGIIFAAYKRRQGGPAQAEIITDDETNDEEIVTELLVNNNSPAKKSAKKKRRKKSKNPRKR